MLINTTDYRDCFKGYIVSDCAVRNSQYFIFMSRNKKQSAKYEFPEEYKVTKRAIFLYLDEPLGDRAFYQDLNGFKRLSAGATRKPDEQFVCVDAFGAVYASCSEYAEIESSITESWVGEGPERFSVTRLKTIDDELYGCGAGGSVCKRLGRNAWQYLGKYFPPLETYDPDVLSDRHFEDIDAFAPDDMYAVGGEGLVWHYDGRRWREVDFPSNMYLESVCCAPDGYVYVGAQSGTVFKGRWDTWQLLHRDYLSLPFRDLVWFQDRLYAGSDYGLWQIYNDRVEQVALPPELQVCSGHLSVGDGVMLMAGPHGAALHNGQDWEVIFTAFAFEKG